MTIFRCRENIWKSRIFFSMLPELLHFGQLLSKGIGYFCSLKQTDRANENVLKGENYLILKCIAQNDMLWHIERCLAGTFLIILLVTFDHCSECSQVSKCCSPPLCSVWSYSVLCDWSAKILHYAVLGQGFRTVLGRTIFVSPHVCRVKILFLYRSLTPCALAIISFHWQVLTVKIMKCYNYLHMNRDSRICLFIFQKVVYASFWLVCDCKIV